MVLNDIAETACRPYFDSVSEVISVFKVVCHSLHTLFAIICLELSLTSLLSHKRETLWVSSIRRDLSHISTERRHFSLSFVIFHLSTPSYS